MATEQAVRAVPPVTAFLRDSPLQLFIGGEWRPASGRQTFQTVDPGSGKLLAEVYNADSSDVNAAVEAAKQAFRRSGWPEMKPNERGAFLHRLADLVEEQKQVVTEIESLDVGKPYAQARRDVDEFCATLRYYIELAQHISLRDPIAAAHHEAWTVRHPYGVCGFIFPWNYPFMLVAYGAAPALAAGNTVVIKPAEDSPLSTLYLARLVKQAGIPDGVINMIPGLGEVTGAALARHPGLSRMSFTGSPEVGRLVAEACARNLVPVKLELGGKGAAVVFDDADVDQTVDQLVRAVTLNAGQVWCTATRWIVHERIYDRFAQRTIDSMLKVRIGYWSDPTTEMGPVVSEKQRKRVFGYLEKGREQGADVLLDGGPADVAGRPGGFYVKPAVLAGSPDNVAAREEIFGPVPFLLKFRAEEEAVDLVNRSPYGLANSVWSANLERASRVAEDLASGNSWINAHNVFVHGVPYAGINLSGMGGGVLGPDTYFDYLRNQSVVRPI